MSDEIRLMLEAQEHQSLHPRATFSDQSRGRARPEPQCPVRPAFQHDRDRILHSKPFRRLLHKTQVFLSPQGDHYRTRMTHTLEVSQIARTLARALRLNEQLTEAIALGHDLGHTPFGHAGEAVLDELLPGGFRHVQQSVRVVELLARDGRGLNLTREVVDGIGKHSKGRGSILAGAGDELPMTLEGQLVRLADIVAYVNHDLDDALRSGVLRLEDIPRDLLRALGETHSERISRAVMDVLAQTHLDQGEPIRLSAEIEQALARMREVLYERVYDNPLVHEEFLKCRKVLGDLMHAFLEDPGSYVRLTGQRLPEDALERRRAVGDFLAGMTDRYALRLFEALFVPRPWPLSVRLDETR
jgi:dGTPase